VYYNVGVTSFRLGHFERADAAFREVARTPAMAPLAWYNLGLVALARGDMRAARRWFARVASSGSDEALVALAEIQLARLPGSVPVLTGRWSAYASFAAGYDDNVALQGEGLPPLPTGEADEFIEALTVLSYALSDHWRVEAGAYLLDYFDLEEFDQAALTIGALGAWSGDEWLTGVALRGNRLTLGAGDLEQSVSLGLAASRALGATGRLQVNYLGARVQGLDDFDGLTGMRHEVLVELNRSLLRWSVGMEFRLADSDCDDPRYASTWRQFSLFARRASPDGRWLAGIGVGHRITRYDVRGSAEDGERLEDRMLLFASLSVSVSRSLRAFARAEHEANRAGGNLFDYDRTRIAIGLEFAR
jgi:hypothetical protein